MVAEMRMLEGHFELCSINTATLGFQAPIETVIDEIARAGFGGIAPWRREVEGNNIGVIAKRIRDAGLKVNAYCRSTYIPANSGLEFEKNIAANISALNDASVLGAETFTMVVGSLPEGSKDLASARAQVADAIAQLLKHAHKVGVKLSLEPLHPVYAADRSCITLLSEALDICDSINDPMLGVCIDAYHVWWDPDLARDVARAKDRIFNFHVSDWLMPTRDVLNDRGMMGDGIIDLPGLRGMIEAASYNGFIETEIFSAENWWKRSLVEILGVVKERIASST